MGKCIRHDPCPECGSRDNVGVYEDGSTFCFGCHHWTRATAKGVLASLSYRQGLVEAEPIDRFGKDFAELPPDYTMEIPNLAYTWLRQFLHPQEMLEHLIGWSESRQRLIFPVYRTADKLAFWCGRYFGKEAHQPKYYIHGKKTEYLDWISGPVLSDKVVVVEDRVSAIKLSRLVSSWCLYGTKIPLGHATKLAKTFSELVIWLDPDKRKEAVQQALKLNTVFRSVKVVFSDKDPKCYENSEIVNFLGK